MDISNKTVLVVGTGKSGVAAAKLLLHHAKKVYIQDGNEALDVAAFRSKNPELTPVELILGDVSEDMLKSFDCRFESGRAAGYSFGRKDESFEHDHLGRDRTGICPWQGARGSHYRNQW